MANRSGEEFLRLYGSFHHLPIFPVLNLKNPVKYTIIFHLRKFSPLPMTIRNALTIDVEDWYHVCGLPEMPVISPSERRVRRTTELVLDLLRSCGVKATFFILGSVAEDEPDLVPMIAGEGHEIASHGWSHSLVHKLSAEEFRKEISLTAALIEQQGGVKAAGFRAPQWSVSLTTTPWAFQVLKEEGYCYDSSLNPLPFIGDPGGARTPFAVNTLTGPLLEMPPLVLPTPFGNMPVGGGWGFRFFPRGFVRSAIRRLNQAGHPAVLYLHPRELDPDGPRLRLPPLKSFAAYGGRSDAGERLRELFGEFEFTRLDRLVDQWHFA